MNKEEIVQSLQENHAKFIQQIHALQDVEFCYVPEGKWSAAQQLDHLVRSVSPVRMALNIPKFILQWRFGLANRPSLTFEKLVNKYTTKLNEGGRATGQFIPPIVDSNKREKLLHQLKSQVDKLSKNILAQNEKSMDTYILPHPLLGKLTFREMCYFTIYHVEHHSFLVTKGLDTMPK